MRVDAQVDDRALREIYLPAFEKVVKDAAPTSVMCAYNAINGTFSSENHWLLTELLRDEWGFDGLVVSDWGAIKDRVEALEGRPGSGDARHRRRGNRGDHRGRPLRTHRSPPSSSAAQRGWPRSPSAPPSPQRPPRTFDADAHHALARRAAAASIVLLRNEHDTLPLRGGQKIAVIGELAEHPQYQGGGSSHVNATRVDIPLDELRSALGEENVSYAPGYSKKQAGDAESLRSDARAAAARPTSRSSSSDSTNRTSPRDSTGSTSICPRRTSR